MNRINVVPCWVPFDVSSRVSDDILYFVLSDSSCEGEKERERAEESNGRTGTIWTEEPLSCRNYLVARRVFPNSRIRLFSICVMDRKLEDGERGWRGQEEEVARARAVVTRVG